MSDMRPQQIPFDLGHRAAFSREDFFVSSSNEEAVGWIDRYPDWPAPFLVIHGPAASGKTHLCHVFRARAPEAQVFDDADKMAGDSAAEEKLFHLYNRLKEERGHALLTASAPPAAWNFSLPDLKSRVMAAPAAALQSPDDALMSVVLAKIFSDRQIFVPQEVIAYIVPRVGRSFAALRDVAAAVDRKALAEKRPVTIPLVRDLVEK